MEITISPLPKNSTMLNKEKESVWPPYASVVNGLDMTLNNAPIIPANIPTRITVGSDLIHSPTEAPFLLVKNIHAITTKIKNHTFKTPKNKLYFILLYKIKCYKMKFIFYIFNNIQKYL